MPASFAMQTSHSAASASANRTSPLKVAVLMDATMHFPVESLIMAPNPEQFLFALVAASTLIFSQWDLKINNCGNLFSSNSIFD